MKDHDPHARAAAQLRAEERERWAIPLGAGIIVAALAILIWGGFEFLRQSAHPAALWLRAHL